MSDIPQVRAALRINVLFLIGVALAPLLVWALASSRWGLILRTAGESADAARAMGYSVNAIRMRATMLGGALAGVGGSFLSLYYPGSWNEGLSSGQGITAVALVIFARDGGDALLDRPSFQLPGQYEERPAERPLSAAEHGRTHADRVQPE